jgi:hypothetical protein
MARRYMKNEVSGNSLQATALVNEVYLRLVDVTNSEWQARAQFFAIAAQLMRRILVALPEGGSRRRDGIPLKVSLQESAILAPESHRSVLALDDALNAFSQVAPRQARVVELLLWWIDGGVNRDGSEDFAADRRTRLGAGQGMAAAGARPYNRKAVGTIDMSAERFRQIAELLCVANTSLRSEINRLAGSSA